MFASLRKNENVAEIPSHEAGAVPPWQTTAQTWRWSRVRSCQQPAQRYTSEATLLSLRRARVGRKGAVKDEQQRRLLLRAQRPGHSKTKASKGHTVRAQDMNWGGVKPRRETLKAKTLRKARLQAKSEERSKLRKKNT